MTANSILLVDDDDKLLGLLKTYFQQEQFTVYTAGNGADALQIIRQVHPEIMVLDLMMPVMDGFEVCRRVRKDNAMPIIFLSARDTESDRLVGLALGGDDYVTKPFSVRELIARVRACLRRSRGEVVEPSHTYQAGDLTIDREKISVTRNGENIILTPTEFKLLDVLASSPDRVFSRLQLMEKAQGGYGVFEGHERTIDTHIRNLRKKIESDPAHPTHILTVYGIGYKYTEASHEMA